MEYLKNYKKATYRFPEPEYYIEKNKIIHYMGWMDYDDRIFEITLSIILETFLKILHLLIKESFSKFKIAFFSSNNSIKLSPSDMGTFSLPNKK